MPAATRPRSPGRCEGSWRDEHLFELKQLLRSWDFHRDQAAACDRQFAKVCGGVRGQEPGPAPARVRKRRKDHRNTPEFDGPAIIHRMTGVDLTAVGRPGDQHGADGAVGDGHRPVEVADGEALRELDEAVRRGATSRASGSARRAIPARGASRVAQAFRLAARGLWRSQSVLGQFLRRMKSRLGPASAIRATAHKLAKLFWRLMTTASRTAAWTWRRRKRGTASVGSCR